MVFGFFVYFGQANAQTAMSTNFLVQELDWAQEATILACEEAKNKIEEAYISLHKAYVSKEMADAKKDLHIAVKTVQMAQKETSKCPCQMANHITTHAVETLKNYKKADNLDAIHDLAKIAMLQTRDAMLEIRNDKLAKF